jgi:hypothetical protein
MAYAKLDTAKTFIVGPVLDADGVADTGVLVAAIKVAKNGTVGAPNGSSTLTHDHTGHYKYAAHADDFDTLGEVTFSLNDGTSAMAPRTFDVLPALTYNTMAAASGGNLPQVVPGGTDGLFIAGTNAATIITTSLTTHLIGTVDTVTTYTGNTKQTADNNTILAHADYGLAQLVRSTTPANTLDINATGEAGADVIMISGGSTEADRLQAALGTGNYIAADTTLIEGGDATDALNTACDSVTVTSIGNDVITAASINTGAFSADAFAADSLVSASFAADYYASINGEIVDVLTVDTTTLPGQAAPPLAPTIEEMLAWLYKSYRNREDQTATLYQLYADNESTVDAKATISDDATTFIKQEVVSGP